MEATPEEKLNRPHRTAFRLAVEAARKVLKRRTRVLHLTRDAYEKLGGEGTVLNRVRDDLSTLLRLAAAWAKSEYLTIPWKPLLYAVAAIVYFVSPLDLFPDLFAGIGFLDDIAVVTAVVASIRSELDDFRSWELTRRLIP